MPKRVPKDCINDCFELYLEHNGENFPAIQEKMRAMGWTTFTAQNIRKKVNGEYVGWEIEFGWKKSLEIKIATAGQVAATSAEGLLMEVETMRKKIYQELLSNRLDRDLVYQHDKYVGRTKEILQQLKGSTDNFANFVSFLKRLLAAATKISPELAKALCEAEDALLDWAEAEFVTPEENTTGGN